MWQCLERWQQNAPLTCRHKVLSKCFVAMAESRVNEVF
ncbi:hypothetical protein H6794_01615 [Candidatus Nomurabacteria bacterium]|nr:hypothetical protein [Candidatus Saccharibacteria bacterium]MCB9839528.1 hypothetical protein [Candidatus Nomurabacteria bacterium]